MAAQEMNRQIFRESPDNLTNKVDVPSLGNRDELTDCPDIFTHRSDHLSADDELIGDHETQLVEKCEADLHKYLIGCTKNPGHKEFIPVGTFSIKHLPEGRREIDLYEIIKATADLIVRVDVRMTSPNRPEVWPDTTVPYPFNNMGKLKNLRTGSGRIKVVRKFTDGVDDKFALFEAWNNSSKCWCKKCKISAPPSKVWWEFVAVTATHVMFDEIQARHTSLRLFHDSDDSPVVSVDSPVVSVDSPVVSVDSPVVSVDSPVVSVDSPVVSVDKVIVEDVNIQHDMFTLKCVSCDTHLGT